MTSDKLIAELIDATQEFLIASERYGAADEKARFEAARAALKSEVDKLKEIVEMVVAYGEIWKAKGYISPTEFEFVLFDAALHALEEGNNE